MAWVYILYSERLDRFYIGSTQLQPKERLKRHNESYYADKYTQGGIPWVLYHSIRCKSREQAERIEKHIKRMKSRKYVQNLKVYGEIEQRLLARFAGR